MNKKNLLVIGVILAVILVVFGVSRLVAPNHTIQPDADAPKLTQDATAEPTDSAEQATDAPDASALPNMTEAGVEVTVTPTVGGSVFDTPQAYLVVTVGNKVYEPLALTKEGNYTVKQGDMENVIHVTKDSATMSSSTCDNQDCVQQGVVTLENKSSRILGNMIICLPNQVTLELLQADELDNYLSTYVGTGDAK